MQTFGRQVLQSHWIAYYSMALNVLTGIIIVALVITIAILAQRERPEPLLLSFDNASNTFVRIIPFSKNKSAMQNMMELQARQYVVLRESIDLETESERYKNVILMSSKHIAETFVTNMGPQNKTSPLYRYKKHNLVRKIKVINSFDLKPLDNAWQVEWQQTTMEKTGKIISTSTFISKIIANLENKDIAYADRFLNVNGFTVQQYLTSKKE